MGEVERVVNLLEFLTPVELRNKEAEYTAGVQAWPHSTHRIPHTPGPNTADFGSGWRRPFSLKKKRIGLRFLPLSVWRNERVIAGVESGERKRFSPISSSSKRRGI